MTLYRKKPVTISAFRWPASYGDWPQWFRDAAVAGLVEVEGEHEKNRVLIRQDRGSIDYANLGDWIIQGVEGGVYPCSDSVFQATYEPVDNIGEGVG
jgi:hypothetical protein